MELAEYLFLNSFYKVKLREPQTHTVFDWERNAVLRVN